MNLKTDYFKLYQHWLSEFNDTELSKLSQEDFALYKKYVNTIKVAETQDNDPIKTDILESYKANFEFILEDLLKIRKIKIMNAALALQEIDLDNILVSEKLLYQNLVRSIKGYEKVKNLSLLEDDIYEEQLIESISSIPEVSEGEEKDDVEKEEVQMEYIEPQMIEKEKFDEDQTPQMKDLIEVDDDINFNYIIVRIIRDIPPLVGIDLKNYGPFSENDIACMPYKNAKILINEKCAEKIDLT